MPERLPDRDPAQAEAVGERHLIERRPRRQLPGLDLAADAGGDLVGGSGDGVFPQQRHGLSVYMSTRLTPLFSPSSGAFPNPAFTSFVSALLLVAGISASTPTPRAVTIHYESEDKLVFLAVRVNESRPLTFILDSGAPHTVIDSTAGVALGLRMLQTDHTTGVGKGSVVRRHAEPIVLRVGEARLRI